MWLFFMKNKKHGATYYEETWAAEDTYIYIYMVNSDK